MVAFKGFSSDLTARHGRGRYQFAPGQTYREEKSKTASCGFHCCENPFDCLSYYQLGQDRFFMVEAAGSIDEDECNRIACTEITLVQELDIKQFAGYGMVYILDHPLRSGWEYSDSKALIAENKADGTGKTIAIARGPRPLARGGKGTVIGLILELVKGEIAAARVFTATPQQAGKWYTVTADGKIEEAEDAV